MERKRAENSTDGIMSLVNAMSYELGRNWYLLFSTYQILYSYCHIPYNDNKEGDFYEYDYYIEILTVFA